jgi:hypothetical protein
MRLAVARGLAAGWRVVRLTMMGWRTVVRWRAFVLSQR